MKILIATNHSYMFYRFRKELVETLMQEHEVILSTPFVGHVDNLKAMGLRCINTEIDRRSINPFKDMKLLKTYRKMLDDIQPDLVITYSIKPNIYMGSACKAKGIPYVTNVQGLGTAFEKPVLSSVVSVMYRSALQKAKTVFFTAAKTIKAEFGEEVAFDVVGFYEDAYKETVDQLVADGVIRFHGFQTDVHPFYEAADCVVLPSYHEGMSNVLLEGAATGRALITSDIPGCREAVEDGVSGYICPAKDADTLYDTMQCFVELPESWRAEMGRRGRERMEKRFSKDAVIAETMKWLGTTNG